MVGLLALLGRDPAAVLEVEEASPIIGLSLAIFLLLAVLVPHVGIAVNGARRWLGHGQVRFQPSELAKLALVLYLARMLAGSLKIKNA